VEAGVPAVLGGVDVFGTGISVLGQNGVPYVGGIPISDESATSPTSFQWSGGTWGAAVAFADHIASSGAKRAAMVHPDFGPINEAAGMGRKVLDGAGVATTDVPYPITGTDLTPALQAAVAPDPDALIVLGADTMCRSAIDAARDLGITATMYYLGACASPTVTSQFPPEVLEGAYFNVEGPISADDPDTVLYGAVMERYARDVDAVGAATVAFRSTINLYRALRSIDARPITADAVRAALGSQVSTPSFMGHPSTCDHRQIEGLPAMCSPQQILVEMHDGTLRQRGTWVDVGAVLSR